MLTNMNLVLMVTISYNSLSQARAATCVRRVIAIAQSGERPVLKSEIRGDQDRGLVRGSKRMLDMQAGETPSASQAIPQLPNLPSAARH